jgi:hypothetical protein
MAVPDIGVMVSGLKLLISPTHQRYKGILKGVIPYCQK